MSERNTNGAPTTAADSSIGLAMIVGEMRSEHTHFVEQVERKHTEIRAEFNSRVSEQDTEIADLREALGNMSAVIQSLVDVTEKIGAKDTTENSKD